MTRAEYVMEKLAGMSVVDSLKFLNEAVLDSSAMLNKMKNSYKSGKSFTHAVTGETFKGKKLKNYMRVIDDQILDHESQIKNLTGISNKHGNNVMAEMNTKKPGKYNIVKDPTIKNEASAEFAKAQAVHVGKSTAVTADPTIMGLDKKQLSRSIDRLEMDYESKGTVKKHRQEFKDAQKKSKETPPATTPPPAAPEQDWWGKNKKYVGYGAAGLGGLYAFNRLTDTK